MDDRKNKLSSCKVQGQYLEKQKNIKLLQLNLLRKSVSKSEYVREKKTYIDAIYLKNYM